MDSTFHCNSTSNFKNVKHLVNAFLYTDYSIAPHTHEFYEMNIVMNGTGVHKIENMSFEVKTGDVFIIPPMTVHAYVDTKGLNVYHILLRQEFITDNGEEAFSMPGFIQLTEIEPFLRRHMPRDMFLHLSPESLASLLPDLNLIERDGLFDSDTFIPLKNHITWKILYTLSARLNEQMKHKNADTKRKSDVEIAKILEYIHKNLGEKITVELLCKKFYLSRSTFLRRFSENCRCTPMEYINRCRCKKAMELMRLSAYSKTEIAHICGFYDLSHMERTIKKLWKDS